MHPTGEESCTYDDIQLRNKFKSCVCICKKAALTIRTATGIAKFRDGKCIGSWFDKLYPLIKSRDSCQPERGMEPLLNENEQGSSQAVYVPIKSKWVKPNDLLVDVVKTVNKLAEKRRYEGTSTFYARRKRKK